MTNYIFNRIIKNEDGSIKETVREEIKPERWCWGVVYSDDTQLHQFEDGETEGKFHQIAEIEWDKVKMFTMYRSDDINKRIDLLVTPDIQIFHLYRNIRPQYLDHFIKVYVFGYKIRGTSKAVYNFILPDDRILISNKDNVDLSLFDLERNLIN